jgi:hypothetical protein
MMFKKFLSFIREDRKMREHQLMNLAKVEYGKDWQYAYYQLINGKQPVSGVKL